MRRKISQGGAVSSNPTLSPFSDMRGREIPQGVAFRNDADFITNNIQKTKRATPDGAALFLSYKVNLQSNCKTCISCL